ncbi:MAG: histidine phosphatase family protein [Rhodospirillales bacterium]
MTASGKIGPDRNARRFDHDTTRVTQWWWIRHAPVIDGGGRLYGQEDLDCDISDAARFAALGALIPADAVWLATPLSRTQKTLHAIARAAGHEPEPDLVAPFLEQHFGDWQGLRWDEMEARDPGQYAAFWTDPSGNAPPAGESFAQVIDRVAPEMERQTRRHAGRDIVCVAHGGSIRAAVAHALDLHHERALSLTIGTLSLTRIDHVEGGVLNGRGKAWRVVGVNT